MQMTRSILAAAALALVASLSAHAQTDRKEVKKEAAAANKAGQTTGDLTPQQKAEEGVTKKQKAASTVDRKEVKKEAAAANKKGETTKGEKP